MSVDTVFNWIGAAAMLLAGWLFKTTSTHASEIAVLKAQHTGIPAQLDDLKADVRGMRKEINAAHARLYELLNSKADK